MRNTPKSLNEELNRMKKLMTFDISENSHDVLSEQKKKGYVDPKKRKSNSPKKEKFNWGKNRKGSLNFDSIKWGTVKNKNLFSAHTKDQIYNISVLSTAPRLSGDDDGGGEPPVPEEKVANIEIDFSMEDSFKLDKVTLTNDGEVSYNAFIDVYNDTKEKYVDIWNDYLSFIKKQDGITISGYASQDGDPNEADGGYLPACSTFGVGVGPKNQYNLCLSQQRANAIRDKIINDIPELSGLLTAEGKGETCKFGPCWSNNNGATTTDTAPNRRVVIKFPEYSNDKTTVTPVDDKTTVTPVDDIVDGEVNWSLVTTYIDLPYGIGKVKAVRGDYGIKLSPDKWEEVVKPLLGNKIPVRGGGTLNNSMVGEGDISKDGIEITAGGETTSFLNWNNPSDIVKGVTAQKRHFKQTDWTLASTDYGFELINLSIALTEYVKPADL